ncbi:MAG: hypothetical protein VCC19_16055 [Myxococcota bacterium]
MAANRTHEPARGNRDERNSVNPARGGQAAAFGRLPAVAEPVAVEFEDHDPDSAPQPSGIVTWYRSLPR